MGLSTIFSKTWLAKDVDERLDQIRSLDGSKDTDALLEIVDNDDDSAIKSAAIEKIIDRTVLRELLERQADKTLATVLESRLNRVCFDQIISLSDRQSVADDLKLITDQSLVLEIIIKADDADVRLMATNQLSDLKLLCKLTQGNCGKDIGVVVVDKISDVDVLERISQRASNKKVRHHAEEKLAAIRRSIDEPTDDELRESELTELLATVTRLADSWNWDYGKTVVDQSIERWSQLDPDGSHRLKADFEAAHTHFTRRRQEFEIRHADDLKRSAERQQIVDECEALCEEVERLMESADGLSMEKLAECERNWNTIAKPDDEGFDDLEERFVTTCEEFCAMKYAADEAREIRDKKLKRLEQFCQEAEKWGASQDWKNGVVEIKALEKNWEKLSDNKPDTIDFADRFNAGIQLFKESHQTAREEEERLREDGLRRLHDLCSTVESALKSEDPIAAIDQVNSARRIWFDTNSFQMINATAHTKLDARFRKACDRFYKRQNEVHEQQDWEEWANLMLMEEICGGIDSLKANENIHEVASALKEMQNKWKKIGPIPKEKEKALWRRFRQLGDREFSRCKKYFDRLDQERKANFQQKESVCDRFDAIMEPVEIDWEKTIELVRELQEEWRTIGSIPQKSIRPMDQRFKSLCDRYYRGHREFLKRAKEEEVANQTEKERLCAEAKAFAESAVSNLAIDKVKRLQADWKHIGKLPRKTDQLLWNRFSRACNKFFQNVEEQKPANLTEKEKIAEQIEALVRVDAKVLNEKNIEKLTERIVTLQKQWKSIGPVPKECDKETWEKFHKPCNEFFEKKRVYYSGIKKQQHHCLTEKEALLFQLESLVDTDEWDSALKKCEQIKERWDAVGDVPAAKVDDLVTKFTDACDMFSDRKRSRFGELKEERVENLKKKEGLCVRLELLAGISPPREGDQDTGGLSLSEELKLAFESNFAVSSPSASNRKSDVPWEKTLDEVRRIQATWDGIGQVPQKYSQQLSRRFRRACDKCFEKKPESQRVRVDATEMKANLEAKLKICDRVEMLAAKALPGEVVNEIRKCQRKWKSLGPVPSRKDADTLWNRYTNACDKVFDGLRQEKDVLSNYR